MDLLEFFHKQKYKKTLSLEGTNWNKKIKKLSIPSTKKLK